jgi:hypothetical protein
MLPEMLRRCEETAIRAIAGPSQLAMENGARRALIPIENRRQFLSVAGDVAERLDPIFCGPSPVAANTHWAFTKGGEGFHQPSAIRTTGLCCSCSEFNLRDKDQRFCFVASNVALYDRQWSGRSRTKSSGCRIENSVVKRSIAELILAWRSVLRLSSRLRKLPL